MVSHYQLIAMPRSIAVLVTSTVHPSFKYGQSWLLDELYRQGSIQSLQVFSGPVNVFHFTASDDIGISECHSSGFAILQGTYSLLG